MKKYNLVETIILEKSLIDNRFKKDLELKLTEKLDKKNKFILINIMKKILIISAIILVLVLGGYLTYSSIQNGKEEKIETDSNEENNQDIGIANPASTYCVEQGGTIVIEEEELGQIGYCLFDDGSKCEEWTFFRGECRE